MKLTETRAALKTDLRDSAYPSPELDRAVVRAVADFSKYFPNEKVYETTIIIEITAEAWTSAAAHGTWVSLANKPIEFGTEEITNVGATVTYVRDTDYRMDYINGKITTISGGSMAINTAYMASYNKSKAVLDITAIITNLIRVTVVELPVGDHPPAEISFNQWGAYLLLDYSDAGQLSDDDHILIFYEEEQTAPTADVAGSYPAFYDEIVLKGALAYCLLQKSAGLYNDADTAIDAAITALGSLTTPLGSATTYAGLASTYAAAGNSVMAEVDATLKLAVVAALDAAKAQLAAVVSTDIAGATTVWVDQVKSVLTDANIPNIEDFLEAGKVTIITTNKGQNVAENYKDYAKGAKDISDAYADKRKDFLTQGQIRVNSALGYVQEGQQRLENILSVVKRADAFKGLADAQSGASEKAVSIATVYIEEVRTRLSAAERFTATADTYQTIGMKQRDEFWAVLRDKAQYRRETSRSSTRQYGSSGSA